MSTDQLRVAGIGLFFLLVFLSGFWLNRSGRPYSGSILTIHKLVSLGAAGVLGIFIYQTNGVATLTGMALIAVVVTAFLFVGTVVVGGLLSIDKAMPAAVSRLHQITPFLTVLSTFATLHLLQSR